MKKINLISTLQTLKNEAKKDINEKVYLDKKSTQLTTEKWRMLDFINIFINKKTIKNYFN